MTLKHTGQCACGEIKFGFNSDPTFVADCYCKDCQRSSGGVMVTYFGVAEEDFTLLSGQAKAYPYVADSGYGLERNFCPTCGARVFTTKLGSFPGQVFVMLGSMDSPEEIIPPVMEIFTKRRISWTKALDVPQFLARPDA